DDGVGPELADHLIGELRVAQVADVEPDALSAHLPPCRYPGLQRLDRNQAFGAQFVVVLPAREVVGHGHVMAALGEMQRSGPSEGPVPAQHQDLHSLAPTLSVSVRRFRFSMGYVYRSRRPGVGGMYSAHRLHASDWQGSLQKSRHG